MSSWRSHLPHAGLGHVTGLGMNAAEMADNPQLDTWLVHNLNREPRLPFDDASFDAVVCAVSVQYLVEPVAVFTDVGRVLVPGGPLVVSFSNRCFPTKAVAIWLANGDEIHRALVRGYLEQAGFAGVVDERRPSSDDPLFVVWGSAHSSWPHPGRVGKNPTTSKRSRGNIHEGCGSARDPGRARDRRRRDRQARAARGAHPHGRPPGCATATSTSWRASTRTRRPPVLGPRVGRRRRGRRRGRHLRAARRPRHHLPVGVLRALRLLPQRAPEPLHRQTPATRGSDGTAAACRRTAARVPVPRPVVVRRADARARERGREGPRRHAARPRRAHRLRRHHRPRRGVQHRRRAGRADRRRHRLRRRRPRRRPGRRHRRRRPHHRRRHGRRSKLELAEQFGATDLVDAVGRRRRAAGARAHRRRRRPRLRGHRPEGRRRAGVRHAQERRHAPPSSA